MYEANVREVLGVSPKTMRTIRAALQPGGFEERGREVFYTDKGLLEIEGRLGVQLRKTAPEAQGLIAAEGDGKTPAGTADAAPAAAAATDNEKTATVTNAFLKNGWLNPRLVSGLVDGKPVRVRVRAAALRMMRPGMVLHVRLLGPGLWESNEMPKGPGRM